MSAVQDLSLLVRLRVRLLLRSTSSRYTRQSKRAGPFRVLATVAIVVWGLATLAGPAAFLLTSLLATTAGRAAFGSLLALASSAATFVMIFYAFIVLVGMLTYRSDLGLLLLAPVSPRIIMAEKLAAVSLGFSPILLLGVPALLGAGHVLHLGILYDGTVVLFVLLLPVLPVSLATLFLLPVLRFLPPARARTVATALGMILGAGIFIVSQLLVSPRRHPAALLSFPSLPATLPSTWAGRMLAAAANGDAGAALVYLAATVGLAAAVFALAVMLSARLLATGSATYHEVGRRGVVAPDVVASQPALALASMPPGAGSRNSGWAALLVKEWLVLRRDPTRLMQLGYPLIIVGFYWYRSLASPDLSLLTGGPHTRAAILPIMILLLLSAWLFINALTPSIVNREGRSLYLLAQAPLTPRDILLAKWTVCAVPPLILLEALLVGSAAIRRLPVITTLISAVTLVALVAALTGVMLCCTLMWPRLSADNVRRQVSGIALLVGGVAEVIVGGAVFTLLIVALSFLDTLPVAAAVALLGITVILGLVLIGVLLAGPPLLQRVLYRATGEG